MMKSLKKLRQVGNMFYTLPMKSQKTKIDQLFNWKKELPN